LRERVAARRRIALAVSALIVAHDAKCAREFTRLVLPHGKICGQRIAQYEPRRAARAIDLIIDTDAIHLNPHLAAPRTDSSTTTCHIAKCFRRKKDLLAGDLPHAPLRFGRLTSALAPQEKTLQQQKLRG